MRRGLQGYLTLSANVNKWIGLPCACGLKVESKTRFYYYCVVFPIGVLVLLLLVGGLSACVALLAALGSGGTAAASSVGTSATAAAIANPVTTTSLATTVATGKSPLEHAASAATKKECNFLNALGPKPICEDLPLPTIVDRSEFYLGPADLIQAPAK